MRIVQVAAEFAPIAKAGGLGEVLVGLSRALIRAGESVELILPKYQWISTDGATLEVPSLPCQALGLLHQNRVWSQEVEGCRLHLIEPLHPNDYFDRPALYGFPDDAARFIYFSVAALEYLKWQKKPIDILHLHDWHTSLCAPLARTSFASKISIQKIVLSLHNLEYQGKCALWDLERIGLSPSSFLPHSLEDPENPQDLNLLKGGLIYSDAIIAVSPTYAKEICLPPTGWGLDATLRTLQPKLFGILNGIDYTLWNPHTDPFFSSHYQSSDSMQRITAAKKEVQKSLAKQFHLQPKKGPWISAVTRLVPQKGVELLRHAVQETLQRGGTFLLLGSSPIPELQAEFDQLKLSLQTSRQALLSYQYDEALAHQIYAASDFFIIPSLFEPCGLSQMISFRYGTLPIVRATGGLKDSVIDYENGLVPAPKRNGIVFEEPSPQAVSHALERAFLLFEKEPATLHWLMRQGMQIDFSWTQPASEYLRLYRKLPVQSHHAKIINSRNPSGESRKGHTPLADLPQSL